MEKRKGDSHPDTLRSTANLANTYQSQDRWNDSEMLLAMLMEKMKQLLGD